MTDIVLRLNEAEKKLGTMYAGLLVTPELKELNHRLERVFTHREIDHEATDLTRELKEIDDVKDLINKAIVGTIGILEDKLKIEVKYAVNATIGFEYAPVKGLANFYHESIST